MAAIEFTLNGQAQTVDAVPEMPLLWVLRDTLGMTGTKFGCGMALCGACTVHLNGEAIRSCVTPVSSVAGKKVTTIEGLSPDGTIRCSARGSTAMCRSAAIASPGRSWPPRPCWRRQTSRPMPISMTPCAATSAAAALTRTSALPFIARPRFREARNESQGLSKSGTSTAGGLLIGFYLREDAQAADAPVSAKLNAFVRVGADDSVTLTIHRAELGQGSVTSLAMLLAEELECDWSRIRTEFAKVDPANYGVFGSPVLQGVFGSLSIRTSWDPLRKAGATAREMLVAAAAQKWGVDRSQCRAENNAVVIHGQWRSPDIRKPRRSRVATATARQGESKGCVEVSPDRHFA